MLVFVGHAENNLRLKAPLRGQLLEVPILTQRTTGVGLFFCLSGFVITVTYLARLESRLETTRTFLLRRFARLWPLYVITVAFALPLGIARHHDAGFFGLQLMAVQSWWSDSHAWVMWHGAAWSVSTEVFFYVAFPLLVVRVLRRATTPRRVATAWVACWAGLLAIYGWRIGIEGRPGNEWLIYVFPPTRLLEFTMGALTARLYLLRRARRLPMHLGPASAIALGAVLVTLVGAEQIAWHYVVAMLPLFSFVIYWLATEHGHVARLLSTRVLCTLGDWSYAFYLLHSFVYVIIGNRLRPSGLLGRPSGVLIAVSLSFVVATCASALAHTVIELPAQRRLHRRWRLGNLAPPSTTELEPAAA